MELTLTWKENITTALPKFVQTVTSPGALTSAGRALRNAIVRNLISLPPNRAFPAASTGFWERAAASVTQPLVAGLGVLVSITQLGVRQRYLGGVIAAPPGKNLTIPAQEAAYGHRAREFDLKVAFMGKSTSGVPILALVSGNPRTSGQRNVMYWLVPAVNQEPNPNVLPTLKALRRAFGMGLRAFVNSQMGRGTVSINDFDV